MLVMVGSVREMPVKKSSKYDEMDCLSTCSSCLLFCMDLYQLSVAFETK